MPITAYTDYPIEDGTNESGVKEIQVLSYDRNKYCTVLRNGFEDEIKAGYIFLDKELKRRITTDKLLVLPTSPEGEPLTRRQLAADRKERKKVRTTYSVVRYAKNKHTWMAGKYCTERVVKSKSLALKLFKTLIRRGVSCDITINTDKPYSSWTSTPSLFYNAETGEWGCPAGKKPYSTATLLRHGFKL